MIKVLRLAAAAVAISAATAAQAVEYSAVSVAHNSMGQSRSKKIYFSNGLIRVELEGAPAYEVLDIKKQTGLFIVPGKKLSVVQPAVMAEQNIAAYSVGVSPCAKILATGGVVNCKKLGVDKLDGRPAEKWELIQVVQGQSYTSTVWVDRLLDAIVKAQSPRGTFEIQNVHFGPQPASLFSVPAGYTTQNMGPRLPANPSGPPSPPSPTKNKG